MRYFMDFTEKIGIMGGTFSPIHNGHLMLAQWAADLCQLNRVFFIPTGCSYLKQNMDIPSGEIRLEMVKRAIQDNPLFEASDIEILRQGNTYTYETLLQLKAMYPHAELYFIIGADCLFSMENWVKAQEIFSNCHIIAAGRDGVSDQSLLKQKQYFSDVYKAQIHLLDFPEIALSSTQIRERVQDSKSIKYMVPDSVETYIIQHSLYKKGAKDEE